MKNSISILLIILLLLLSACTPAENKLQNADKTRSTPEAMGISSRAILDFVDALEREQKDAIHSIMLRRHGEIIQCWVSGLGI